MNTTIRNPNSFVVIQDYDNFHEDWTGLVDLLFFHVVGDMAETITLQRPQVVKETMVDILKSITERKSRAIELSYFLDGTPLQRRDALPPKCDFTKPLLVKKSYLRELETAYTLISILVDLTQSAIDQQKPLTMPGSQLWILTDLIDEHLIPNRADILNVSECIFIKATK